MGDVDKVRAFVTRANNLDPLNEEIAEWGMWSLIMTNQLDEALKFGEEKVELLPNIPYPLLSLSVAEYIRGNSERSIKLANKGVELSQRSPYSLILLAQAYASAEQYKKALELVAEAQAQHHYMCPYETAVVYIIMDEYDVAFQLFDEARDYQSNCLIFARNDPRLKLLRNDQRYLSLLKNIGLDETMNNTENM